MIFSNTNYLQVNGVFTTKTAAKTECDVIAGFELVYNPTQGRCVFNDPSLYTNTLGCRTTR